MITEDSSDEMRVWPKRAPDQHQLFASVDKWLAFLPYLSKPELDKCREVSEWTDWLIEKHSGGELKQRRQLFGLAIALMTLLDMDKWMEGEEEMENIEAKAKGLIGEMIYPYEPEDATVQIEIQPRRNQYLYLEVKNLLDEKDALLIARLMPRITPPMAVFECIWFEFNHTPDNADGSGGGPVKLITRDLIILGVEGSSREGIKTAELTAQCQLLYDVYDPVDVIDTLRLVAVARPLNAPAWIDANIMEEGRLDEILSFFTRTVPGFESAAPRLRVTIEEPATWPESLRKESANNPREEQLAGRLYKFRRYNHETGEELEIEVCGYFGNIEDEGKGEEGLRVAEMVLHFRPDVADK